MAPSIHTTTARQGWLQLLEQIRQTGELYTDQDGRECKEVLNSLLSIENPADTLTIVRHMQRQSEWVYPSAEELRSIILGSATHGTHEYSYVARLFGKINQIDDFVIPLLRTKPESRRAAIVLYQADTDSKVTAKHVPGLLSVTFRLQQKKLELTCHVRSNDVFIGFPANAYQLRCLQEYVAEKLGVKTGALHVFSSSAHYFPEYEEQYALVTKAIGKEERATGK